MFSHISALFALVVAVAASARMERHIHIRNNTLAPTQCNTGDLKCCNSMYNATDFATILDRLSEPYDTSSNVGINCTPLNIDGAGEAAACQQQPLCCSNQQYEGFINVGCSPMNVN